MGRAAAFNREEAVAICMNEMWRHGFEACSVKALSERLKMTRSSFYNAFTSREALFKEVLEHYAGKSPDRCLAHLKTGEAMLPILNRLFKTICTVRAEDPEHKGCLIVNSVAELVGVHPVLGSMLQGIMTANVERLEQLLTIAASHGEVADNGDLHSKALALKNLIVGLNLMAKFVHSEQELYSIAEQTLKGLGLYVQLEDHTAIHPRCSH